MELQQHCTAPAGLIHPAPGLTFPCIQDENLPSDDDDDDDSNNAFKSNLDQSGDEIEDEDYARHARMLQGITGMPAEAFEGNCPFNSFTLFCEIH